MHYELHDLLSVNYWYEQWYTSWHSNTVNAYRGIITARIKDALS